MATSYTPSKKPDFVCPFCMGDIYSGDMRYFCNHHKELDEKSPVKTVLRKVFKPEEITSEMKRAKNQIYCCSDFITRNRLCPNCVETAYLMNPPVPYDILRTIPCDLLSAKNEIRICMTGLFGSGKIQFIAQLLEFIASHPLPGIDSTFFLDMQTQQIRERIRNKFLIDGILDGAPSFYLEPLLFDIRRGKRSYVGIFYDISEECLFSETGLQSQCIASSNNILFVIDPTRLPGVQDHPNVVIHKEKGKCNISCNRPLCNSCRNKQSIAVQDSLNSCLTLIRSYQQNFNNHLRRTNIAIVFTKMDLFYSDDNLPEILKNESSHIHRGRFDIQEIEAVNNEMKYWIHSMGGDSLLAALRNIPNACLFGISSGTEDLGIQGETNRILDPYLWLLYKNSVLR